MRLNFKLKPTFGLFWAILLFYFAFVHQAIAQQPAEESQLTINKEVTDRTRIVISTSGPAKFSSYWLDEPFRLVVEFQTKNIVSKIDNEVIVNQGVIKRITSSYFGRGKKRSLKSLTFELTQKVPYKIWQENNAILLDIQAPLKAKVPTGQVPLEVPVFQTGGEEIFTEGETSEVIIKRLEAMDAALIQLAEGKPTLQKRGQTSFLQAPLETPEPKVVEIEKEAVEEITEAEEEVIWPKTAVVPVVKPTIERKAMVSMVFWLWVAELILILTLGFLVWRRRRASPNQKLNELNLELNELNLELQEKNRRLEQEQVIRKAIEATSLQKEKEYQQLKNSFASLKGELIKKGLQKGELSPEEKERPWIPERLQEKRAAPRLPLTRDFSKTITLRVKSYVTHQSIKSFVNNISSNGLCFMTREEFKDKEPINLSLIFYGDMSSITSIQAHIAWKSSQEGINYYGVSFDLLEEKGKLELNRFIESKMGR